MKPDRLLDLFCELARIESPSRREAVMAKRCKAELEGRQALFVVNMAPRKMAGEVSEGMIYDIGYEDGILPALAVPEREVPNGVRLG